MKRLGLAIALTIGATMASAAPPPPKATPASPAADTVLRDGEIRLPDGWAHTLAVSHGVIVAVGDDAAVDRYRTSGTRSSTSKARRCSRASMTCTSTP